MWIGEQIDAYGIGNGISLLIMAGIIARMPDAGVQLLAPAFKNGIRAGNRDRESTASSCWRSCSSRS